MTTSEEPESTWLTKRNIQLCSAFITGQQLPYFVNKKNLVFVVGLMGAGKSTVISVQQGATFQLVDDKLKPVSSSKRTPKRSSGFKSKTLQALPYEDDLGRVWVDTAGLNENRGVAYLKWTSWNLVTIFQMVQEVRGVVLNLEYNECLGSRGDNNRLLAQAFSALVGRHASSKYFYDNMVLVVSNVNGGMVKRSRLVETWKDMKTEEETHMQQLQNTLLQLYGKRKLLPEAWLASASLSHLAKVPSNEMEELRKLSDTIKFLDACLTANEQGRILESYLPNVQACYDLQRNLNKMVDALPGITHVQLKQICSERETNDFEMSCMLSKIVQDSSDNVPSLLDHLKRSLDCLKALYRVCEDNRNLLEVIEHGDWKSLRDNMVQQALLLEDQLEDRQKEARRTINHLEDSASLVPLAVHQVRVSRTRLSAMITLGLGGWAEHLFKLQGSSEYDEYSLKDGSNYYTKQEIACNPKRGELCLRLLSSFGHDLNVDIHILREERYHPSTLDRVSRFKGQIKQISEDLISARHRRAITEAITDKVRFRNFVLDSLRQAREVWIECDNQLKHVDLDGSPCIGNGNGKFEDGKQITKHDLLTACKTLIPLLHQRNLLSKNLASGDADVLSEFVEKTSLLKSIQAQMEQDPCIMKSADIKFEAQDSLHAALEAESDAPTHWFPVCSNQIAILVHHIGHLAENATSVVKDHSGIVGVCLVALSWALKGGPSLFLFFIGALLTLYSLQAWFNSKCDSMGRFAYSSERNVHHSLQRVSQTFSSDVRTGLETFKEQLNVKVNLDSKDLFANQQGTWIDKLLHVLAKIAPMRHWFR